MKKIIVFLLVATLVFPLVGCEPPYSDEVKMSWDIEREIKDREISASYVEQKEATRLWEEQFAGTKINIKSEWKKFQKTEQTSLTQYVAEKYPGYRDFYDILNEVMAPRMAENAKQEQEKSIKDEASRRYEENNAKLGIVYQDESNAWMAYRKGLEGALDDSDMSQTEKYTFITTYYPMYNDLTAFIKNRHQGYKLASEFEEEIRKEMSDISTTAPASTTIKSDSLSEEQAISALKDKLGNNSGLEFLIDGIDDAMGEDAYRVYAYYDNPYRTETYGYYYVTKSGKIYEMDYSTGDYKLIDNN